MWQNSKATLYKCEQFCHKNYCKQEKRRVYGDRFRYRTSTISFIILLKISVSNKEAILFSKTEYDLFPHRSFTSVQTPRSKQTINQTHSGGLRTEWIISINYSISPYNPASTYPKFISELFMKKESTQCFPLHPFSNNYQCFKITLY